MDAWMGWMGRAGQAIVEAADDAAVQPLLERHSHEGTIDVLRFLAIPGM